MEAIKAWTSEDVTDWLTDIGLSKYSGAFTDSDINGASLVQLDRSTLDQMGVLPIHVKKILRGVQKLTNPGKKNSNSDRKSVATNATEAKNAYSLSDWRKGQKAKVLQKAGNKGIAKRKQRKLDAMSVRVAEIEEVTYRQEEIAAQRMQSEYIKLQNTQAQEAWRSEVNQAVLAERDQILETIAADTEAELQAKAEAAEAFRLMSEEDRKKWVAAQEVYRIQVGALRRADRQGILETIVKDNADELQWKQEFVETHKVETEKRKIEIKEQMDAVRKEITERILAERDALRTTLREANQSELNFKQNAVVKFKSEVTTIKKEIELMEFQRRTLANAVRQEEKKLARDTVAHASKEELDIKQRNIEQFKAEVEALKKSIAEAKKREHDAINEMVLAERKQLNQKLEAEAAQEIVQKREFVELFQGDLAVVKQAIRLAQEQRRKEVHEIVIADHIQDHERVQNAVTAERKIRQNMVSDFKAAVTMLKSQNAETRADFMQQVNATVLKQREDLHKEIATEAAEEIAMKTAAVQSFQEFELNIKQTIAAAAETRRVTIHASVMKQHAQIAQTITAEEATELAMKKAQAISFKSAVKEQKLYIKTQLDALTQQITLQVVQEREELRQAGKAFDVQRHTINVINHDQANAIHKAAQEANREMALERIAAANVEVLAEREQLKAIGIQFDKSLLNKKQDAVSKHRDYHAALKVENDKVALDYRKAAHFAMLKVHAELKAQGIEEDEMTLAMKLALVEKHMATTKVAKAANSSQKEDVRNAAHLACITMHAEMRAKAVAEDQETLDRKQKAAVLHREDHTEKNAAILVDQEQRRVATHEAVMAEHEENRIQRAKEAAEQLASKQKVVAQFTDSIKNSKDATAEERQALLQQINMAILSERNKIRDKIAADSKTEVAQKAQQATLFRQIMADSSGVIEEKRKQVLQETQQRAAAYRIEVEAEKVIKDLAIREKQEEAMLKALPATFLKAFEGLDQDGDGLIDFFEFQTSIAHIGLNWDEQTSYKVFKKIDADGNGTLDQEEFMAVMEQVENILDDYPDASPDEILKAALETIVVDDDEKEGDWQQIETDADAEMNELEVLYKQRDALVQKLKEKERYNAPGRL